MKLIMIVILLFILVGANAHAQTGSICAFSDPTGSECDITDDAPGSLSIYFVYVDGIGIQAAEFLAPRPSCMVGASWIIDTSAYNIPFGNTQTGIQVTGIPCVESPVLLATAEYVTSGTTVTDCPISVYPFPGWATPRIVDCDVNELEAFGGVAYINSSQPCDCGVLVSIPIIDTNPETLNFGSDDTTRQLLVRNIGGGTLNWSVASSDSWLTVNPSAGIGDQTIDVFVDRTGLADGLYTGELEIMGNSPVSATVQVSMTVADAPVLYLFPPLIRLYPSSGPRRMSIGNAGAGTLNWQWSVDRPWVDVQGPMSGSGGIAMWVALNFAPTEADTATISVTSNGGSGEVRVSWSLEPPDTPLERAGVLGVYADTEGMNCNIQDTPGLFAMYVVHTLGTLVGASQFSAPIPACMTGVTFLGETSPGLTVGNSQSNIAVGYGACYSGPVHVLTMQIFGQGLSQTCCPISVLPASGFSFVVVSDCSARDIIGTGGTSFVNPDVSCNCSSVGVEESTWGYIKSLYGSDISD